MDNRFTQPYLVIPKLIEQPTWGGEYIAKTKGWLERPELKDKKIGQSYELFSGSNLSLVTDSSDPAFMGELHDRDSAQWPSSVPNSVPLAQLVEESAEDVLGQDIAKQRGHSINLLIKFTQALGNSFQLHIKDGQSDPYWKPKPESWYFFEPGLVTLGVKKDAKWEDYQAAIEAVDAGMKELSGQIQSGQLTHDQARPKIDTLIRRYDPWQFVNLVEVPKNGVVDASVGGLHHSWEEDAERLPLGNVLYELQTDTMDDVSTLRSFDRGKIGTDGSLRDLHISDYFRLIDRSPETNDPVRHMRQPQLLRREWRYELYRLLSTKYYGLDVLELDGEGSRFTAVITQFAHLFVKRGHVTVATGTGEIVIGAGHSCFVPAAAGEYKVVSKAGFSEVLISS